jgi:hypothetical protein
MAQRSLHAVLHVLCFDHAVKQVFSLCIGEGVFHPNIGVSLETAYAERA